MSILLQMFNIPHSPEYQCINWLIFMFWSLVNCFDRKCKYLQSCKVIHVFLCGEWGGKYMVNQYICLLNMMCISTNSSFFK